MLMLYILFILCRFPLAIVLFVLFRFTAYDYPFGIFKSLVYPFLSVDIEMKFYTLYKDCKIPMLNKPQIKINKMRLTRKCESHSL
jgi:hypothetical protein